MLDIPSVQFNQLDAFSCCKDGSNSNLDESDIYKLNRLAHYLPKQFYRRQDKEIPLFNLNAELCNPYFTARFWEHCRRLGSNLPDSYFESLHFELISVFRSGLADTRPIQHLVSAWAMAESGKTLRIAGGLFTSDLSIVVGLPLPDARKRSFFTETLEPLFRSRTSSGFDVLVIGFPMPRGMRAILKKPARLESIYHFDRWDVAAIDNDSASALTRHSLTGRCLIETVNALARCYVIWDASYHQEQADFVIFALQDRVWSDPLPFGAHFWEGALSPLISDHLRILELRRLPGQKNRLQERKLIAKMAAIDIHMPGIHLTSVEI